MSLKCDEPLSKYVVEFNLRRYLQVPFAYNGCELPVPEDLDGYVIVTNATAGWNVTEEYDADVTEDPGDLGPAPGPGPTPAPGPTPGPSPAPAPAPVPAPGPAPCTEGDVSVGCECGSAGGGNGLPDNPFESTGLCCDKAMNVTVEGSQMRDSAWCVKYSPPPRPPPPMPPPLSPPPNDVCSKRNMAVGCKCASQGFGNGLPDNPPSTSPLCCDEASKKTVTGAQMMSSIKCVKYSPPPRPPPPMPPPPSLPPADVCSSGNFFAGCKKCGDSIGVNCPPVNTGLCCHKPTRVAVTGARATTTNWCARSVSAPTLNRRLLAAPAPPSHCCNANHAEVGRCRLTVSKPVLKAPTVSALSVVKQKYGDLISSSAFQFVLRRYSEDFRLITAAQCCDPDTLTLVDGGAQCTSTRWCRAKDCVAATKIPKTKKCVVAPAPAPAPTPAPASAPAPAPAPSPALISPDEAFMAPAPGPTATAGNDTAVAKQWAAQSLGEAVQVESIKPMLKAPATKRLKLTYDSLL